MSFKSFWSTRHYQRLPTSSTPQRQQPFPFPQIHAIPVLLILILVTANIMLLRVVLRPIYKPLDDYQIMNVLPVVREASSSSLPIDNRAVVTTLYSDNYAVAAAVLGHSLRSVNSTARLVLLYIDGQVSHKALCISKAAGWEPIAVPRIAPPRGDKSVYSRFVDQYTKLNLWGLDRHGIENVVYLDSDTLIRRNFDELFDLPFNFAAVPDVYNSRDPRGFDLTFNAGVMVLKTSSMALTSMKDMISKARYPPGQAEQAFLNMYFAAKAARLPYIYNANLAIKQRNQMVWRELREELSIIHYTIFKPFLDDFSQSQDKILTPEETERAVDHAQSSYSDWAEEFGWWRATHRKMMEDKASAMERCTI